MKKICISLVLLFGIVSAQTEKNQIVIPAIFSDNMVLQQKSDVTFWGKAEAKTRVTLTASWGKKASAVVKDDNSWSLKIKTPKAGGPFEVNLIIGDSTTTFKNVLIGEVWLCSGQSNMEMPMAGFSPTDSIATGTQEIANANYGNLRFFTVQKSYSIKPEFNVKGAWLECSPKSAAAFSATAFFFGKKLMNELKIPIGLIHSSWGGTPAEAWTGIKKVLEFPNYKSIVDQYSNAVAEYDKLTEWLRSHKKMDMNENQSDNKWQNLDFEDKACSDITYDDAKWKDIILPKLWELTEIGNFDGAVWFRKKIEIPKTWINQELELQLGPIDDMDITYVNGEKIGAIDLPGFWQKDRIYTIPAALVKDTNLVLAVRVLDTQGGGGIYGTNEKLKITLKSSGESLSLAGAWKYLPVAEYLDGSFYMFNPDQQEYFNRPQTSVQISASSPSTLYNAMIAPLVPYKIKGAIWYQGEANVGRAAEYKLLFPKMIENWREDWKDKFSFYFTQIAPWRYGDGSNSQEIREAQLQSLRVPKTGMAVTLDIGNIENIHPANKKDVGDRLALWALSKDYGKKVVYSGPVYKSMKIEKNKIILSFDYIAKGLEIRNRDGKTNFQIAGEDRVFKDAFVTIVNNKLIISSEEVKDPKAVRYCWSDIKEGTLFNSAGLPASSFRTDNW